MRTVLTEEIKQRASVSSPEELLKTITGSGLALKQFKVLDYTGLTGCVTRNKKALLEYCGSFTPEGKVIVTEKALSKPGVVMVFKHENGRIYQAPYNEPNLTKIFLNYYITQLDSIPVRIKSFENSDAIFGLGKIKSKHVGRVFDNYTVDIVRVQALGGEIAYRYMMPLTGETSYGFVASDIEAVFPDVPKGYNLPKDRTIRTGDSVEYLKTGQVLKVVSSHNVNYTSDKGIEGVNRFFYCEDAAGEIIKTSGKNLKKL